MWTCPPILIHVAESSTSDDILQIDIAETLLGREGGRNVPSPEKRNDDNCYWFASTYNSNDDKSREVEIIPIIKAACRGAGFRVNCKYKKMENDNGCIEVKCCRGTYHYEEKSTTVHKSKKKKTIKPVCWDNKRQRWFLPKAQRGGRVHCGHEHMDPVDINLGAKNTQSNSDDRQNDDSSMQIGEYDLLTNDQVDDIDGTDLVTSFHPRYVNICNYAESAGDVGIRVMTKHFDHCQRRFLEFIHNAEVSDDQVVAPDPPESGSSACDRFKNPFEAICRMAQRTGIMGIQVASEELLACQQELVHNIASMKKSASRR
eukprot:scaffold625_cov169-Skeletonema_dohrnii-CCMP3373.AAC.11